jgi:hypothetical protein
MSFAAFSFEVDDPPPVGSLPAVARPTGTPTSTGTDSWSLLASRVTGGAGGSGKTALEVDGDPRELWCCGMVSVRSGGSKRFCTMPVGTCKVQAHQSSRTKSGKHEVEGFAFYIQATEKSALLAPRLDKMFLSERDLSDIRGQKLTSEQWNQLFVLLQSQVETRCLVEDESYLEGGVGGAPEELLINVKTLAARVERAGDYQTPRKPVGSTKNIKMEVGYTTKFDKVTEVGIEMEDEDLRDVMTTVGSNWNKSVGVVVSLETSLPLD